MEAVAASRKVEPVARLAVDPAPVAKLRLVEPIAHRVKKQARGTGSTGKKELNVDPDPQRGKVRGQKALHPPTIPGHRWKPSGLSGWELYTRRPSISENGKRSSTGDYIAYYSQKAVEGFYARETKTDTRRVTGIA